MSTIAKRFWSVLLLLVPGFALADTAAMATYLSAKPLRMEIRFCECAVTASDGRSTRPLPSFMATADALNVAVDIEDKGFIASEPFTLGYAIQPDPEQPDQFRFQFVGDYSTSQRGHSTAQATLLLVKNQWVTLFGSRAGNTETGVAVRLTDATGP